MGIVINYPDTIHVDISRSAGGWAVLVYTPGVGIEVVGEYAERKDADAKLREIYDARYDRPGVACCLTIPSKLPEPPPARDGAGDGRNGRTELGHAKAARASAGVVNLFVDLDGWDATLIFEREDAAKLGWSLVRAAEDRV